MRKDELPFDYEADIPGPTGFYKNIVHYPELVQEWSDERLGEENQTLKQLLDTQPKTAFNSLRLELMRKSMDILQEEFGRRDGLAWIAQETEEE